MPSGEDILRALEVMYRMNASGRPSQHYQVHCDTSLDHDRGRYGEIIKPVTEASIVASEINPLIAPTPPTPPAR